jgi:hypothetical protein
MNTKASNGINDGRRRCACGKTARFLPRARRYLCDNCARAENLLIKCHGEAHSNAYIDNCSICAPRWGWVEPTREVRT